MSLESSAQRYAIALFEMARDGKKENVILSQARQFSELLKKRLLHP